jgi:nucleotide-binding universal stress UspA family protein
MYKKIVVAIDGSDCSQIALEEAIKLAKDQKAKLLLLHVIENLFIWEPRPSDVQELQASVRKTGQDILTKGAAFAHAEGITVETKLVELLKLRTRIAELILEEVYAWSADLLVISTHGRRGVHRLLIGSVAEGIIRQGHMPILLIPSKK